MGRAVTPPSLRSLLGQPRYRRLLTTRTVSQRGDTFNFVALALLVFRLTGSGLGVSGVVIAEILPVLAPAPSLASSSIGSRRYGSWWLPTWRVCSFACLLVVAQHNLIAVYAVAFGLSASAVFFNPAAASLLPGLVDDDQVVAANSGI
jgi:hypothetical protein